MTPGNDTIEFGSIVDKVFLQKFQDAFSRSVRVAALSVDLEQPITTASNFTEFCMEQNRKCPEGARRCNACDLEGGRKSSEMKRPVVYDCHAGLTDMAAPIMIGNQQVGSILAGQVLTTPPDLDKFRRYATEIGCDPDRYVAALQKVPVVPRDQIEAAAELLYLFAGRIGEMWHQRSVIFDLSGSIDNNTGAILDASRDLTGNAGTIVDKHADLSRGIKEVQKTLEQVEKVLAGIKNIAHMTRLLGMNASIEAARAGEVGRGFGVVAQEVRVLSEQSHRTAEEIQTFTSNIYRDMTEIISIGDQLKTTAEVQKENIEDLMQKCTSISDLSLKIKSLSSS